MSVLQALQALAGLVDPEALSGLKARRFMARVSQVQLNPNERHVASLSRHGGCSWPCKPLLSATWLVCGPPSK